MKKKKNLPRLVSAFRSWNTKCKSIWMRQVYWCEYKKKKKDSIKFNSVCQSVSGHCRRRERKQRLLLYLTVQLDECANLLTVPCSIQVKAEAKVAQDEHPLNCSPRQPSESQMRHWLARHWRCLKGSSKQMRSKGRRISYFGCLLELKVELEIKLEMSQRDSNIAISCVRY